MDNVPGKSKGCNTCRRRKNGVCIRYNPNIFLYKLISTVSVINNGHSATVVWLKITRVKDIIDQPSSLATDQMTARLEHW
jgi:hypothetical protein